jgi:hypothetical protein
MSGARCRIHDLPCRFGGKERVTRLLSGGETLEAGDMNFYDALKTSVIAMLIVPGCNHPTYPEENGEILYASSFESDSDTAGWHGYGSLQFRSEPAPDGGKRSLHVSGGCIVPHAEIELGPPGQDSRILLSCWGKNLGIGGTVGITMKGQLRKYAPIAVQDTVWTFYESKDTLFAQAGSPLILSVMSGGIVPSAMLLDLIEVRRIP